MNRSGLPNFKFFDKYVTKNSDLNNSNNNCEFWKGLYQVFLSNRPKTQLNWKKCMFKKL